MASMGTRRLLLVVPPVLALVLAGCGGGNDGPSPDPTAAALASGLASGDLSQVSFVDASVGDVQREYDATVAGLGDVKPKVTVASVTKGSDGAATATLQLELAAGRRLELHEQGATGSPRRLDVAGRSGRTTWSSRR